MALTEWDVTGGGGGGANVKSGIESGISENSTRAVAFGTTFAATPRVTVSLADSSTEISIAQAHDVTVAGFTIRVVKSGGGGSATRDVSWVATDAGNS